MTKIRFRETVKKLKMDLLLREYGTVIVGYSGGADSSCLLFFMHDWCKENGVRLAAAHVNHMIRGEEADRDEDFCRKTAERLGIELFSRSVDVPAIARESGRGLEETARDERYKFFDELSEKLTGSACGAVIATAHNASDNVESVLMNMMRGSGLHGMCGISPERDGRIIRPLIEDSGDDIRMWCAENGIEYVTDSTNCEDDCTRNVIRHRIVPVMRELCSSPEASVARMTALLRADDEYLDALSEDYAADRTQISREVLVSLDPSVASRTLIKLYNNAKTGDSAVTDAQIGTILRLAREKSGHSEVSLSGSLCAVIERDSVAIVREKNSPASKSDFVFEYTDGTKVFENGLYRLTFSDEPINISQNNKKTENIYKLSTLRSFDSAKIKGKLKIRYKADGDAYVFCGHTHKLKKLFTDSKLTEREKKLTPVVVDDDGIVWVAGFGTREDAKLVSGCGIHVLCEKI